LLLCLMVVVIGCVVSLPEDHTLSADIACETARMVTQLRHEIAPTPASDKCDNCVDGVIGDGTIKITCPICKGTGKRMKSVCKDCPK
jgi:DnaJ-class molecular chaperone